MLLLKNNNIAFLGPESSFFVLQLGATNVQNIEMHNIKRKEQSRLEKKKIMHLIHQKKISILEEQRKNRNGAYINDFFQFILQ